MSGLNVNVPINSGPGIRLIRAGEVILDTAYEESTEGRLRQAELWVHAVLEAMRVFAQESGEGRELQLAAINKGVEQFNEALMLLVEAKFRED